MEKYVRIRRKLKQFVIFPISKKKIKQFLELAGYYRRLVKGFAKIAWPLSNLLREYDHTGKQPFVWGEAQQQAFDKVNDALYSKSVLMAPDLSKEFVITTDASDFSLGDILVQGEIGKDHACQYASRCLRGPELRYSTYDRELLAIVFAKEQFRPFLYGRKFTVITDHESLKHFHNTKKPDLRFNRLKAELCGYDFEIIYRPRPRSCNADALSRNPILQEKRKITTMNMTPGEDTLRNKIHHKAGQKKSRPKCCPNIGQRGKLRQSTREKDTPLGHLNGLRRARRLNKGPGLPRGLGYGTQDSKAEKTDVPETN